MTDDEAIEQLDQVGAGLTDRTGFRQFPENRIQAEGFDFRQLADWTAEVGGHVDTSEIQPPRLPGQMIDGLGQDLRSLYVPEALFDRQAEE